MKIGIPIWEDKISPVLDTASRFLVIETDGKKEFSRYETHLEEQGVSHRCFRIQSLGVDILICGAISRLFLEKLMASGIRIIPGVSGHPEEVLFAYLQGNIYDAKFMMPGVKRAGLESKTQPLPLGRKEQTID